MANSIAAAAAYLNGKLDAAYKAGAKSAALDINPAFVRQGDLAGTFYIPTLALTGLGNVTAGVMPEGSVTQTWVAHTYGYDRGRKLQVEVIDRDEGARVAAIANVAKEYMRVNVIPELDAIRFARIATAADSAHKVQAALTTSSGAIAAVNAALVALSDDEADMDNLLFFATANVLNLIESAASTEAKCRITNYTTPIEVPSSRFGTAVTCDAGSSDTAGGFTISGDALNFLLVDKGACFADAKHQVERIFPAEINQAGDLDRFDYRIVHDAWVLSNRTTGVYAHSENTVS